MQFPAGPLGGRMGSRADASCVLHTRRQGSTPCGSTDVGSWSRRYDTGMACRQPGFDSRRVHSIEVCSAAAGRGVRPTVRPTGVRPTARGRRTHPDQLSAAPAGTSEPGGPWRNIHVPLGRTAKVPLRGAANVRTGTGYGWPGRFAKAVALTGMWVRIPPPPLCFGGETDITPRFERGVPGSNPGRSTQQWAVESGQWAVEDDCFLSIAHCPLSTAHRNDPVAQRFKAPP